MSSRVDVHIAFGVQPSTESLSRCSQDERRGNKASVRLRNKEKYEKYIYLVYILGIPLMLLCSPIRQRVGSMSFNVDRS